MINRKHLEQPENPSTRFPLEVTIFRCDFCGKDFEDWKRFLNHMATTSHRICYKCGQNCGGMEEYNKGEYIAIHQINGNIESWKYKHLVPCPFVNPSQRGR